MENKPKDGEVKEYDEVFSYTAKQAEEDGILFDITNLNKEWKKGLFNYVTVNLLQKGYFREQEISIPNILDLLNQALFLVKSKSKNFKDFDHFFSGNIEFPNGDRKEIFICQNETGKFTIMLPEDY
ncbi:hypothetical protein K9K83_00050 [Candidatus Woesearchaeota archaeon]|nr:hypothetical protein [Candidatus Woesearchaeota archaeon]